MNDYYDIAKPGQSASKHQLKHLGDKVHWMTIGGNRKRDMWGDSEEPTSKTLYRETTKDDYDKQFASALVKLNPAHGAFGFLEHHLHYYMIKTGGEKSEFLKQIKYVVKPCLKSYTKNLVFEQLVDEWLNSHFEKKMENNGFTVGTINAPTQIQINSPHASQSQISYSAENVKEFISLLKRDIQNLSTDNKAEFEAELIYTERQLKANNDVVPQLMNIKKLILDVGISFFVNLTSSGVFEIFKPILGF
jgi:hypothetical protein